MEQTEGTHLIVNHSQFLTFESMKVSDNNLQTIISPTTGRKRRKKRKNTPSKTGFPHSLEPRESLLSQVTIYRKTSAYSNIVTL
jgi:hypothetical protein